MPRILTGLVVAQNALACVRLLLSLLTGFVLIVYLYNVI